MSEEFASEINNGKNARNVKCKHCTSIILKPETAELMELEYELPTIKQNMRSTSTDTELIKQFWVIKDMFVFHNIAFSNTVGNTKYLACADCDAGPVGYHDLSTKINYVAISRVDYA